MEKEREREREREKELTLKKISKMGDKTRGNRENWRETDMRKR